MMTPNSKPTNKEKIDQLREAVAEALAETLRRGFFGSVGLEWNVNDGVIQDIRRRVEKIRR